MSERANRRAVRPLRSRSATRIFPGNVPALAGIDLDRELRGDGRHHGPLGLREVDTPPSPGGHRLPNGRFGGGRWA